MSEVSARIAQLWTYPVKSCGGVNSTEAVLTDAGLDLDRAWMVVDTEGEFVSQRELPRMALVQVQMKRFELVLRAPGMLALHLNIEAAEAPTRVRVWSDVVPAYDMGDVAAQWFSDFLGQRLRLVRFDPDHRRLSDPKWTGGIEALNQFSDGFALLAVGAASLAQFNDWLAAAGQPPVGMERFRPNIVLDGLEAFDEDRLDGLLIETGSGPVRLKAVKPCVRCSIPDVEPQTAQTGVAVGDALRRHRSDPRMGGAPTFGVNLIVEQGDGMTLAVGQPAHGHIRFD